MQLSSFSDKGILLESLHHGSAKHSGEMECVSRKRKDISAPSDVSGFEEEPNPCDSPTCQSPHQLLATTIHRCENGLVYFYWPSSSTMSASAEERANYFTSLQICVLPGILGLLPKSKRANTLIELLTIRAFHSKTLRGSCIGTAVGFRIRDSKQTDDPAILLFVTKKVHKKWLPRSQCFPSFLQGPGGTWCDCDVVEIIQLPSPDCSPVDHPSSDICHKLRGGDAVIGPGSQIATQDTMGTLGAIVTSLTGNREVGFLTNRHVAVDLDYPSQKMYHPMPPARGPSVFIGTVERATSYASDDVWYGVFASTNPETFVRADGAFVPFANDFDMSSVTATVRGLGKLGEVKTIDLQAPVSEVVGKKVVKLGSSSGFTRGTVVAYALEYKDERGVSFLNDLLVMGDDDRPFDVRGDSGSLVILEDDARPIGLIWGGTSCRSQVKTRVRVYPQNWTTAVDLGRLLHILELSLVTGDEELRPAVGLVKEVTVVESALDVNAPPPCEHVEVQFINGCFVLADCHVPGKAGEEVKVSLRLGDG